MQTILKILNLLSGKKTSIATILGAILVFVLGRGYIGVDLANLIATIFVALGLTVNISEPIIRRNEK